MIDTLGFGSQDTYVSCAAPRHCDLQEPGRRVDARLITRCYGGVAARRAKRISMSTRPGCTRKERAESAILFQHFERDMHVERRSCERPFARADAGGWEGAGEIQWLATNQCQGPQWSQAHAGRDQDPASWQQRGCSVVKVWLRVSIALGVAVRT